MAPQATPGPLFQGSVRRRVAHLALPPFVGMEASRTLRLEGAAFPGCIRCLAAGGVLVPRYDRAGEGDERGTGAPLASYTTKTVRL